MKAMKCQDCVLRRERCFRPQSESELAFAMEMHRGEITLLPGRPLIEPGRGNTATYTLLEGWVARYRLLPDGSRYVLDILLPGDFVGLLSSLTGRSGDLVAGLTTVRLCVLDREFVPRLMRHQPDLSIKFFALSAHERGRIEARSAVFAVGTAARRLAYFCLEIFDRLQARGLASQTMCPFPLNRGDLSEILGLSEVHVSRVVTELRRGGLIHLANNILIIPDRAALLKVAGMEPPVALATRSND